MFLSFSTVPVLLAAPAIAVLCNYIRCSLCMCASPSWQRQCLQIPAWANRYRCPHGKHMLRFDAEHGAKRFNAFGLEARGRGDFNIFGVDAATEQSTECLKVRSRPAFASPYPEKIRSIFSRMAWLLSGIFSQKFSTGVRLSLEYSANGFPSAHRGKDFHRRFSQYTPWPWIKYSGDADRQMLGNGDYCIDRIRRKDYFQ